MIDALFIVFELFLLKLGSKFLNVRCKNACKKCPKSIYVYKHKYSNSFVRSDSIRFIHKFYRITLTDLSFYFCSTFTYHVKNVLK